MKRLLWMGTMVVVAGSLFAGSQSPLLDDHFDNNDLETGGDNAVNGGFQPLGNDINGVGTASEDGTLATIVTAAGVNNHTGIESLHSFDATSLPGFTVTWVVDSVDEPSPEDGNLSFGADSDSGLYGSDYVYLQFRPDGKAYLVAARGGIQRSAVLDKTATSLTNGFTLSLTFNANGISWMQDGIPTFHKSGSLRWDELSGDGQFGYDDVFGAAVRVSAWRQNGNTTPDSLVIDRVTVVPEQ
jgi:hypothetical protein